MQLAVQLMMMVTIAIPRGDDFRSMAGAFCRRLH